MYELVKRALERSGESLTALVKFEDKAMDDEAVEICLEDVNWSNHLAEFIPTTGLRMKFKKEFQNLIRNRGTASSHGTHVSRSFGQRSSSSAAGSDTGTLRSRASGAGHTPSSSSHHGGSQRQLDVERWVDTGSTVSVNSSVSQSQRYRRDVNQLAMVPWGGQRSSRTLSYSDEDDDQTTVTQSWSRSSQMPPFFAVFETDLKQKVVEIRKMETRAESMEPSLMQTLEKVCKPNGSYALGGWYGTGEYFFNGTSDLCLCKIPRLSELKKALLPIKVQVAILKQNAQEAEREFRRCKSNWPLHDQGTSGRGSKMTHDNLLAGLMALQQNLQAKVDVAKTALADHEMKLSQFFKGYGYTFQVVTVPHFPVSMFDMNRLTLTLD